MSVSAHFAPGRQRIKSSDRQVLVLLLVLSEMARCSAPVSVWCCLHQLAASLCSKQGSKKGKTDTSSELIYSLLLPNNHFYVCATLMCVSATNVCEWCVKRILCVLSSPRESGKNDTHSQHPVRPWGHSSESWLPQTRFVPFVNTVHTDVFTGTRVDVCSPADACEFSIVKQWASNNSRVSPSGEMWWPLIISHCFMVMVFGSWDRKTAKKQL